MDYSNVTLVIPSHNNLRHLKNVYTSIRKFYKDVEVILLDDCSTDGTWDWMTSIKDENLVKYTTNKQLGHTILYDVGIDMAKGDVVGILHADMIIGPNYLENLLKHLDKGKVVCATRIEPPLHPEGNEKIIKDFGMDFDTLNVDGFEEFVVEHQQKHKDETTRGMFAPWILYREDFQRIGGHDPLFHPFPYEDSDIFQRWILQGYELTQSRDSFVYHLTCRGHRWTEEIGKNDDYFPIVEERARLNYIRKWGSWIKNDSFQYPIISPVYKKTLKLRNSTIAILKILEPWFTSVITDLSEESLTQFIDDTQPKTMFDLTKKFNPEKPEDIVVEADGIHFDQESLTLIQNINDIIHQSGGIGKFELGKLTIFIDKLEQSTSELINIPYERANNLY